MTLELQLPFDLSNATKLGPRRFRKQILPLGSITYKGRRITFDKAYLTDLSRAFKAGVYDQVPFILANEKNEHHEDPRLFEGAITDLVMAEDGLDAELELTPEGAALVEKNPKLGVSARIVEGLERGGRVVPRAIRHVLATMDPRVQGMRPWAALDLSAAGDNIQVVDLTAETYQGRNTNMSKTKLRLGKVDAKSRTATIDLSGMSDDDFEALVDLASGEAPDVEIDPETGKPVEVEDDENEDEVDPDEIEDPDATDAVVPGTGEKPPVTNPASGPKKRKVTTEEEFPETSAVPAAVTSLSNDFAAFRQEQRAEKWQNTKSQLARDGVPPFLLDLAEPHMLAESNTIDLSNGSSLDAKETITKMLAGFTGMVDLTPEMGHSIDLSEIGAKDDPDEALLKEWSDTYGN